MGILGHWVFIKISFVLFLFRLIAKYRPTMPVLSVVIPRLQTNQLCWTFTGAFEVHNFIFFIYFKASVAEAGNFIFLSLADTRLGHFIVLDLLGSSSTLNQGTGPGKSGFKVAHFDRNLLTLKTNLQKIMSCLRVMSNIATLASKPYKGRSSIPDLEQQQPLKKQILSYFIFSKVVLALGIASYDCNWCLLLIPFSFDDFLAGKAITNC